MWPTSCSYSPRLERSAEGTVAADDALAGGAEPLVISLFGTMKKARSQSGPFLLGCAESPLPYFVVSVLDDFHCLLSAAYNHHPTECGTAEEEEQNPRIDGRT